MDRRRTVAGVNGYPLHGRERPRAGRRGPSPRLAAGEAMRLCFPEKSRRINPPAVPKPTQVGGYRHTKARERNLVKELGKIAP